MNTSFKTLGVIPARLGSQRFPAKMLASLGGDPLIVQSLKNARRSPLISDWVVATDAEEIASVVRSAGGRAIMTAEECPSGTDRIADMLAKHPEFDDYDYVLNIQGDEPFVSPETLEKTLTLLFSDERAVAATAAVPFPRNRSIQNPNCVKVVTDQNNNALYFSRAPIPYGAATPLLHLGIYAYKRDFVPIYASLPKTPLQESENLEQLRILEHNYRLKVALVQDAGIGIDTLEDLLLAEKYLCQNKNFSSSQAVSSLH